MTMPAVLTTIIIYARNIHKTVAFYSHYFGFETTGAITEGLVELKASQGGINILVHQAAKSVKLGQAGVKLSFDVEDIAAFVLAAQAQGLAFGTIHQANGYQFANTKDPDNNSISISSRAFRNNSTV
ncbi:VOC family protein [Methylophilus sp. Leaf414]|uniref:VOC family protein n=1 Tax=Methylophilus sp. Leaf414 TaxID=1736371 RepID=UPI000A76C063|nr:VOC family protein [Methylophilus sp. Leaf414]